MSIKIICDNRKARFNYAIVEKYEAEIQSHQRQINQLTSLIIQGDKDPREIEKEENNIKESSDFGLFRVRKDSDYGSSGVSIRENSLLNILTEKDKKISELETIIKEFKNNLSYIFSFNFSFFINLLYRFNRYYRLCGGR